MPELDRQHPTFSWSNPDRIRLHLMRRYLNQPGYAEIYSSNEEHDEYTDHDRTVEYPVIYKLTDAAGELHRFD